MRSSLGPANATVAVRQRIRSAGKIRIAVAARIILPGGLTAPVRLLGRVEREVGSRTTDAGSDRGNAMLRLLGEPLRMWRYLPIVLLAVAGCSSGTDRSLPIG